VEGEDLSKDRHKSYELQSKGAINWALCCENMDNKSSAAAEMGDHLATVDMGQKEGGAVPILGGSWVSI